MDDQARNPRGGAEQTMLGPFRLLRELGAGASGVVWLAERVDFAQRVAVKVFFHPAAAAQEAEVLARLDHPHIVRLIAHDDGWLAMELVEGARIDATQAAPRAQAALLIQVLEALEHAHARLVIHGDLKPANLLVTPDGQAKVLDFGVTAGEHTPQFASPEQRTGGIVTLATDVYSLGLVGQRILGPVKGDLARVLTRATAQDPEQRYLSAAAFRADLCAWLDGRPLAGRTGCIEGMRKWMGRNRLLATASVVFALVLVGSIAGVIWQTAKATHEQRVTQARLRDLVRLTGSLDGELYESLGSLPAADPARKALVVRAGDTLDKLAEDARGDPGLAAELAGEYDRLGRIAQARGDQALAAKDLQRAGELRSRAQR